MRTSLDIPELKRYVSHQLNSFFPDEKPVDAAFNSLAETLENLETCINKVKLWEPGHFDHLHSTQYCIFLYLLARNTWTKIEDRAVCNKLFYLNKALNGIDLFYEIKMPDYFFIGHSPGIVLAKAQYSNYLVLYQNSTIGRNTNKAPALGEGTILYPNSAIIGECVTGKNSTLSQGARLINKSCPENSIVFNGDNGEPILKKAKRRYIEDYFRL